MALSPARSEEPQTGASTAKDRRGTVACSIISRINEPSPTVAEQELHQVVRRQCEGYQYVLLGHPPDDIDPNLLVRKRQKDDIHSVDTRAASADDKWTMLLCLPEDIKIIGFDQLEAFLDLKTGSVSPIGRLRPGPSGDVMGSSGIYRESQHRDEHVPKKWKDVATMTDGTVYLVPTDQDHESGQAGIWEFGSVDSLLRLHQGRATTCRFIPVPVVSIPLVSAATSSKSASQPVLTLHPGHSHLLIHSARPYPQTFGLGDNRFHSACPSATTSTGSLRVPCEIDSLAAVPIRWVGAGDRASGVISEAGEAWIWGKGAGKSTMESVTPVEECIDTDITFLAVAESFEVAVTEDNSVWGRGQSENSGSLFSLNRC